MSKIKKVDEKKLNRYFCVYFNSDSEEKINKRFKFTKVIQAKLSRDVEEILINEYGATYIKSIRDLENPKYYLYNEAVHKIELKNNFNLYYEKK